MSPAYESETMKGRIEDAVTSFLEAVHRPWPEGDPRSSEDRDFVVCCFAESLARLLIGDSFRVVWEETGRRYAALLKADDAEAAPLTDAGVVLATAKLASLVQSAQRYVPLDVTWYRDVAHPDRVLAFTVSTIDASAVRGQLTVLRDGPGEQDDDWDALSAYLPGLKMLYLTLGAVMQARASAEAAAQRLSFEADVRELVHDRSKDVRDRLEATARLAERLVGGVPTDRLDAVERAVVSVLQELLGAGWSTRDLARTGHADPDLREWQLVARIAELVSTSVSSRAAVDPTLRSLEARRLIASIDATTRSLRWLLDPESSGDGPRTPSRETIEVDLGGPAAPSATTEPLQLLPLWVRLHELARPLAGPRYPTEEARRRVDAVWRSTVDQTLPLLARYLSIGPAPVETARRAKRRQPSARNWLRLWFCLVLLREERARSGGSGSSSDRGGDGASPLLDVERDRLRAELAFALRESLRFACFGERRDFFFQASAYAGALRLLVEQHAQWIVELPGDYTRRLLHDIGEAGGPNHYLPAEHLQHVLEVYIAGHFMLSVRVRGPGSPAAGGASDERSMAQVLAEIDGVSRGEPGARVMRQAYSLAALFHDVGHLLFPDPQPGMNLDEPRIKEVLGKVQVGLAGAARGLINECVTDLGKVDYLREGVLIDWFETHREESEPNHGLLSAWYLLRAGGDNSGLREVLAKAIRAVLLHGAMTVPITPEDPLAALLVMCNEVFEWDPRRPASSGSGAVGRSFHVMAAESHREPRDLYLKTQGLSVAIRDEASGTLDAVLDTSACVRGQWPEIHVTLQSPQRLDVPVFWLWLAKAQNLGRIQPVPSIGWAPSLVLRSRVPTQLRLRGLGTRAALSQAITRIYGPATIRQWLANRDDFHEESKPHVDHPDRERAHIRSGAFPLDTQDVRRWLRKIRREIENICLQIDAGGG